MQMWQVDRSNDPRYNFDANPSVGELIAQQGKGPVSDPSTLLGDLWPDDEPIEEFLAALHGWRGHNRSE
jgi:phage protein U